MDSVRHRFDYLFLESILSVENECSIDGCDSNRYAKGLCNKHWQASRARQRGIKPTNRGKLADFIELIQSVDSNDCIVWPFAKVAGYGVLTYEGKRWYAHRLSLSLFTGVLMQDMEACHIPVVCHNPSCVNPKHLMWGSKKENAAHRVLDTTHCRGESNGRAKLKTSQVICIRGDSRSGLVLAKEFGVSPHTISNIRTGKTWSHLV